MTRSLPILLIIPHGGYAPPEELSGLHILEPFDLFFEADACAHDIFRIEGVSCGRIVSEVSRVFMDVDRAPMDIPPRTTDGVIKVETPTGRQVYPSGIFPDEIAIANMLKRYYFPFHASVEKTLASGRTKLILECHTMMPVGPENSADTGSPRPLFSVQNITRDHEDEAFTAPDRLAIALLESLQKSFGAEEGTVAGRFAHNSPAFPAYILGLYGRGRVPMLRLSVSRSLFLTDRYFSYERMKVDAARLAAIRTRIGAAVVRFFEKNL
jgi:N-formylglutamate deformylase